MAIPCAIGRVPVAVQGKAWSSSRIFTRAARPAFTAASEPSSPATSRKTGMSCRGSRVASAAAVVRLASEFISRSTRASSVAASRPGLRLISRGTGDAAASAPILALTGKTAGPEMPNGVAWTSPNDSIAGWPSGRATSLTLRSLRPARRLKNASRQTSGTSAGRGATMRCPSAAAIRYPSPREPVCG